VKVYNKLVIDIDSGATLYEDSFEYEGEIAHCGGGGGGGDINTAIFTNLIPTYIPNMQTWAVSYLTQSLALSLNNFYAYTGNTYATQNANELAGISALIARGTSGSQIEADGETHLKILLTDGFIDSNSFRDTAFTKAVEEISQTLTEESLPSILDRHAFAFGGSEHNIAEAVVANKAMANINEIAEKIYYDNYRLERRLQDAGIAHAVPYGQRGIRDAEILRTAGVYGREYLQGYYTDLWKKWNEQEIIPTRNLDILGNAVRSILGVTRTATTTYYKPPAFNEIAGLATTGLGLYAATKKLSLSIWDTPSGNKINPDIQGAKLDYSSSLDQWTKKIDISSGGLNDSSTIFDNMKNVTPQGKQPLQLEDMTPATDVQNAVSNVFSNPDF
jgi:hypothetical protein